MEHFWLTVRGQDCALNAQAKTGIEEHFTMVVDAIVDALQNYEAHILRKTPLNHRHERTVLYQSGDDYYSDSSSDEYVRNEHETHDTLFGRRYNNQRHY